MASNNEEKTELQKSIDFLVAALKEDKSEGSYYYSWQANIAMSFFDEFIKQDVCQISGNHLHSISNNAAKNFLDMLIYVTDKPEENE